MAFLCRVQGHVHAVADHATADHARLGVATKPGTLPQECSNCELLLGGLAWAHGERRKGTEHLAIDLAHFAQRRGETSKHKLKPW